MAGQHMDIQCGGLPKNFLSAVTYVTAFPSKIKNSLAKDQYFSINQNLPTSTDNAPNPAG